MNLALHTLASKAVLWHKGRVRYLSEVESRTFPPANPARVFPRMGRLRLGGAAAVQHSATTCGPTVLALANALFDPDLLAYLQVRGSDLPASERATRARERFTQVQQRLLAAVTGWTWPAALGTPPWGLARELRVPAVSWEHLPVDDRDPALTEVLTMVLQRALGAGIPVPLYVGGSLPSRVASAVPRHVVLLVPPAAMVSPPSNDHARIYDPASGRVYRRPWRSLWQRSQPDRAFGGWARVAWAVLPRAGHEPVR